MRSNEHLLRLPDTRRGEETHLTKPEISGIGIRQFTVGTGGAELYPFTTLVPNSEVRINTAHDVLALRLAGRGYEWAFISVSGATMLDSGSGRCPETA